MNDGDRKITYQLTGYRGDKAVIIAYLNNIPVMRFFGIEDDFTREITLYPEKVLVYTGINLGKHTISMKEVRTS